MMNGMMGNGMNGDGPLVLLRPGRKLLTRVDGTKPYTAGQRARGGSITRGHPLMTGRMLVGTMACFCGRHITWRCDCGAITYGPPLGEGCSLLDGLARVR
jgi:hypothetical protein